MITSDNVLMIVQVVLVGRSFGLIMIGLSIAWLPILQMMQGGQLWDYIQAISSFITPPWVVAFVLGCFWPRLSEKVRPFDNSSLKRFILLVTLRRYILLVMSLKEGTYFW